MISKKHKTVMINLLLEYANTQNLIPEGMFLDVNLSLVTEQKSELNLLDYSAKKSFKEYFEKKQEKVPMRVLRIFTDTDIDTIRDVVTFGIGHKYGVSGRWQRVRRCGQGSLDLIDEWLQSLNLRRGMNI